MHRSLLQTRLWTDICRSPRKEQCAVHASAGRVPSHSTEPWNCSNTAWLWSWPCFQQEVGLETSRGSSLPKSCGSVAVFWWLFTERTDTLTGKWVQPAAAHAASCSQVCSGPRLAQPVLGMRLVSLSVCPILGTLLDTGSSCIYYGSGFLASKSFSSVAVRHTPWWPADMIFTPGF